MQVPVMRSLFVALCLGLAAGRTLLRGPVASTAHLTGGNLVANGTHQFAVKVNGTRHDEKDPHWDGKSVQIDRAFSVDVTFDGNNLDGKYSKAHPSIPPYHSQAGDAERKVVGVPYKPGNDHEDEQMASRLKEHYGEMDWKSSTHGEHWGYETAASDDSYGMLDKHNKDYYKAQAAYKARRDGITYEEAMKQFTRYRSKEWIDDHFGDYEGGGHGHLQGSEFAHNAQKKRQECEERASSGKKAAQVESESAAEKEAAKVKSDAELAKYVKKCEEEYQIAVKEINDNAEKSQTKHEEKMQAIVDGKH